MINKTNSLLCYFISQSNENGIFPAQKLFNQHFCTNLPSVKPFHKIHLLVKLPDPVKWPILYWPIKPTNKKFTKKFSYDNIIPATTKSQESITPLQTANLPKPVTSLTTINQSKPVTPNEAKVT